MVFRCRLPCEHRSPASRVRLHDVLRYQKPLMCAPASWSCAEPCWRTVHAQVKIQNDTFVETGYVGKSSPRWEEDIDALAKVEGIHTSPDVSLARAAAIRLMLADLCYRILTWCGAPADAGRQGAMLPGHRQRSRVSPSRLHSRCRQREGSHDVLIIQRIIESTGNDPFVGRCAALEVMNWHSPQGSLHVLTCVACS